MQQDRLERILEEMRNESVSAEELGAAQQRVWESLTGARTAACAELRGDLAEYAAGRLGGSRLLLVEDHLSRCPACRRTLAEKEAPAPAPPPLRRPLWTRWPGWAAAAAVAALTAFLSAGRLDRAFAPRSPRATVASVEGGLYRFPNAMLAPGASLAEAEIVRTSRGSRATLRLADGSLVEMNERTELSVHAAWSGQSVHLERGDVIVEAARQRRGRLRVVTADSTASVKGTVFAVSAGMAGTVVAVLEGSVEVRQPDGRRLLQPGERAASTNAVSEVGVRQAVAWSANAGKYFALLAELEQIGNAVAASSAPPPRGESGLLPLLPAGAIAYGAVPNLGNAAEEAVRLIEQRSQESEALREWWTSSRGQALRTLLERMQTLSPLIGSEIAFVLVRTAGSGQPLPLVMAEVQPGRQDELKSALERSFPAAPAHLSDRLLAVSDTPSHLSALLPRLGAGAASEFGRQIASEYERGVGTLLAINAAEAAVAGRRNAEMDAVLGAGNLKHILIQEREVQGSEQLEAAVVFSGPRSGLASWLAAPGPIGSAEYVSPDAVLAISAATRNPREAFQELTAALGRLNPRFQEELAEAEAGTGVSIADDLAAALGTDFTFAIERPTLPLPGWVLAAEVYQPDLIDGAARRLVERVNAKVPEERRLALEEQQDGGLRWMTLRSASPAALHWTYDRGYLVAASGRELAQQAVATRAAALGLTRSQKFRQLLPASADPHQSGFLWLNTQGALANVAGVLRRQEWKQLLTSREPVLAVVRGDRERIEVLSRTRLAGLLFALMNTGGRAHPATRQAQGTAAANEASY